MPYYLLLSRSITHAQRMSNALEEIGIRARIFRPPLGLTDKGCGYALRVSPQQFRAASERLLTLELRPVRVFFASDDGAYHEIKPL